MGYGDSDFEHGAGADEERPQRRLRPWVIPAALVLLAGSGAIAWVIVDRLGGGAPEGPVPLVTAETEPVKVKPEEPGGMEVPNQDKLIYDRITGEGEGESPEQLLPAAEEPALPQAGEAAEKAGKTLAGEGESAAAVEPAAEATPGAEAEDAETAAAAPEGPAPGEQVVAAEATPAAETTVPAGDFLVQVASVRSQEGAEMEAARLAKAQPDLLGGLAYDIQRADLGAEKGVYFRTRFGPFERAEANALCVKLKERRLDCLVVKR